MSKWTKKAKDEKWVIDLTLEFPEAGNREELRQLARTLLYAGKAYGMVDCNVLKFDIHTK